MKSKTLIAMAVAGTFGLSAAAFAGSGHEVITPASPNESYPSASLIQQGHGFQGSLSTAMAPSESIVESTGHELALSDSSDWSASFDQMAEADVGDIYLIGFAPTDTWDYYVIDTGDSLALIDDGTYYLVPVEYISFVEDDYSMSQEDAVSMHLSMNPVSDTASVG